MHNFSVKWRKKEYLMFRKNLQGLWLTLTSTSAGKKKIQDLKISGIITVAILAFIFRDVSTIFYFKRKRQRNEFGENGRQNHDDGKSQSRWKTSQVYKKMLQVSIIEGHMQWSFVLHFVACQTKFILGKFRQS